MRLSPATKQNTRVLDIIKNHGWFLPLGKGHFGFLFVCLFYINRKQKFSLTRNMVTSQSFSAASFILYSVVYYTAFRHFHIQFNFICVLFFVSNVQADYEHIASLFKKSSSFSEGGVRSQADAEEVPTTGHLLIRKHGSVPCWNHHWRQK